MLRGTPGGPLSANSRARGTEQATAVKQAVTLACVRGIGWWMGIK